MKRSLLPLLTAGIISLPAATQAQGVQTNLGSINTFGDFVSLAWAFGSEVILGLAIVFFIVGAFFYIGSAGREDRIGQGKDMMIGAGVAVTITLLSGTLIRLLHQPLAGTTGALREIPQVMGTIASLLIGFVVLFTVVMLTWSGILFIAGKGDPLKLEKAGNAFRYAIYGMVLGLSAYVIISGLIRFLSA